ncbi:lipopolysaccharide biosynthesis protein [Leadbetterella byssophila DSM 17132]|uniref:Lipopolysaccharide biosynthesis protein n=1 Tax=Leadbetterella byssophila (strain DSM 17132 / JCM 16389 / KACC 11308 / NBRC 106382 / 4M15) TaxID=649349 RepID=E4RXS6_LEAB4|nr:Wzz/FepE/Etk N-terminal domain-containing protein [Leadbetterella byssophila]ADQ18140.1 lipopolysaccharide biosynthesis protein [Leadbetterella byssophila DSM 17132]
MEKEINIDFKAFFRIIWNEKWRIIIVTLFISILGLTYSLMATEEFKTQGKILPELQSRGANSLSQFAGLASLAGLDLNSIASSGIDAVRPDLYPDVLSSTPFYLELFKLKVKTKDNVELTFEEFLHKSIEKGKSIDDKLVEKYKVDNDDILILNKLVERRIKILRNRLYSSIDKKSGIITITVEMPDPVVAAAVARFSMEYLMNYVKDYRTKKLTNDVEYLERQLSFSRNKYYSNQEAKARYSDQFQDMALQSADIKRERIESEYRISSTFYNELLKKYEEAKFKLHQETPVFKILEPPIAPSVKSSPKRTVICLISIFLGSFLSLIYVILKDKNYHLIFN